MSSFGKRTWNSLIAEEQEAYHKRRYDGSQLEQRFISGCVI